MADPFLAEIRIFPFNFAPKGWAVCNGQIMPISQNTAVFSLLGTTYGGDGRTNFALPNLQGSVPMHPGQGQGLSLRSLGEVGGSDIVTLLESEIPSHTHSASAANTDRSRRNVPTGNVLSQTDAQDSLYGAVANMQGMGAQSLALTGGSQPHNNLQPYLTLNFCIALQGIFPSRG